MGGVRAHAVAFITGVVITAAALTRDHTAGEETLRALASGEIWARHSLSETHPSSLETSSRDASARDDALIHSLRSRIDALELGEATRAALASTRLTFALWARVCAPAAIAGRDVVAATLKMGWNKAVDVVRETEPRVLVTWALACVGALYTLHLFRRLVKHLKRARYRNKLRFFIIRMRMRAIRRMRALVEPYAKVYRKFAAVGAAVRRRYSLLVQGVRNKSRTAASALPHVIFLVLGFIVLRVMPRALRQLMRKREALATIALLSPMFRTMLAVESHDMALVEKWLRFWASCAPFMVAVDFPLIFYGVRWFFPWWPEVVVLFTIWLNLRLTQGSHVILEFATPLVSRALEYLNQSNGRFSALLRQSFRQTLQVSVIILRFRSRRAADAMRLIIDNMSIPLVMCTVFFFTPGLITIYGCSIAGLAVPFAYTVDGLLKYHELKMQPTSANRAQARKEAVKAQEDKLQQMLTYWLANAMIWSLSQELSKSALGWFPLWRHTQLAGIYWLQVFGGAQRITERMKGIKDKVVLDHQQALKAAIEADLEASINEARVNGSKISQADVKLSADASTVSGGDAKPDIVAEGLRQRTPTSSETTETK